MLLVQKTQRDSISLNSSLNIENGREARRGCRLAWSRLGDLGFRKIDWTDFEEWLLGNHHKSTVKQIMRYARTHHQIFQFPHRASKLASYSRSKRRFVMTALSNLSKYLGIYGHWKSIMRDAGLKWEKKTSLEVVLDIMDVRLVETKEWLIEAIQKLSKKHASVLIFNVLTGLRPSEGYNSCRLIVDLSEKERLTHYLNRDMMMLEYFRFKELFLRRCKNAYISFITPELLDLILKFQPRLKYTSLNPKLRKHGLAHQTKQLRKYHATLLREHLPSEVIDLLQGRINQSIFLRYYYKPLLRDIQQRTIKGLQPLQSELLSYINS